jgi:hypothetical protein
LLIDRLLQILGVSLFFFILSFITVYFILDLVSSSPAIGALPKTESCWLEACWTENQGVYSAQTAPCRHPVSLRKSKSALPLALSPLGLNGPLGPEDEKTKILQVAIDDINDSIGFKLFYIQIPFHKVKSHWVVFDAPLSLEAGEAYPDFGTTYFASHSKGITGFVFLTKEAAVSRLKLIHVLKHELLHLAGLQDEAHEWSVMYPLPKASPEAMENIASDPIISYKTKQCLNKLH